MLSREEPLPEELKFEADLRREFLLYGQAFIVYNDAFGNPPHVLSQDDYWIEVRPLREVVPHG